MQVLQGYLFVTHTPAVQGRVHLLLTLMLMWQWLANYGMWYVLAWAGIAPTAWWLNQRYNPKHRRRREGRCPNCGYDMRASPARCPECGAENPSEQR